MTNITLKEAQEAKEKFLILNQVEVLSVGITKKENNYALAVGVVSQEQKKLIPAKVGEVPVIVSVIGEIKAF